ncbi:MAG: long-chain fatty acid--CoA ligase [Spirochaetaceae bacterium]|nr:MAG: long-chain fatty acid--CoA ligase [Spirochaetaceae bacterium]
MGFRSAQDRALANALFWPYVFSIVKTLNVLTLPALVSRSVESFPDLPAFAFVGGQSMTFADCDLTVRETSRKLSGLGVTRGDRVAILSENMPNWAVAYLATTTMGAVAVPILPDFTEVELANIIEHAGVRLIFVSRRLAPKIAELKNLTKITLDDFSGLPEADAAAPATADASDSVGNPTEDDLAAIIYTSGTTGNSKGVMLTHKNIVSNVEAARPIAEMVPGECMVSILPLSHTYECTIGMLVPFSAGVSVYYLEKPPSPTVLMPALEKIKPHLMLSVPLFIEKIYRARVAPKLQGSPVLRVACKVPPLRKILHRAAGKKVMAVFGGRLHFFGIGGAAVAPDVEQFMRDAGFPYAVGYGLTETAPLLAGCGPSDTVFRSTGPALEGVEIRVAQPDPDTGEGEIQARGPNIMRGYYRDDERTTETFTEDGWFRTGDLGTIDERGRVFIKGRLKNMILGPNGENIYPEEIEAVINAKPLVDDSLVMQKESELIALVNLNIDSFKEYLGEMSANVTDEVDRLRAEAEVFLGDLRDKVNAELRSYSRITRFIPQIEPFEKTPTMKIKRYLYESRHGAT